MAISPSSSGSGYSIDVKIMAPTSEDVLSQQLQVKYRNCAQIRKLIIICPFLGLTFIIVHINTKL